MKQLQQLVEKYKLQKSPQLFKQIQNTLLSHFYTQGLNRFKEDQLHRVIVSLFVPSKEGAQSDLEKSLDKYQPDYKAANGQNIPFFPFFFNLLKRRINTIYEEDKKVRRRELSNDQVFTSTTTEPQQIQQFTAASGNIASEVVQELLAEQIIPTILQAEQSITNQNYRDPFLFMLLFPNNLSQQDIATLFGIKSSTINANLRRAKTQFAQSFNKLIKEETKIEIETLNAALNQLSLQLKETLEKSFKEEPERSAIISRFTHGWKREKVCQKYKISLELLKKLEQKVLQTFFSRTQEISNSVCRTINEGETDMAFYKQFRDYLSNKTTEDTARAPIPITDEEFACFELIKKTLPTADQRRNIQVIQKISSMTENEINQICKTLALSAAELSNTIEEHNPNDKNYQMLLDTLNLNNEQSAIPILAYPAER